MRGEAGGRAWFIRLRSWRKFYALARECALHEIHGRRDYCQLLPATVRHVCCCASVPACRVQRAVRPTPNPHLFAHTWRPVAPLLPTTPKQYPLPTLQLAQKCPPGPPRFTASPALLISPQSAPARPIVAPHRYCSQAHIPGHEQRIAERALQPTCLFWFLRVAGCVVVS